MDDILNTSLIQQLAAMSSINKYVNSRLAVVQAQVRG